MYLVSFVAAIYGLVLVCYVSAVEVRQARRGKARQSEAAVTRREVSDECGNGRGANQSAQ